MFVKFLALFRRAEVSEKRARSERLRKRFCKKETQKNCSSTAGYSEVKYPPSKKLLFYLLIGVKYMKRTRRIWNRSDPFDPAPVKPITLLMNLICFWKHSWKHSYDSNSIASEDKPLYEFF